MNKATIIHLSDIHFNGTEESMRCMDALINDLNNLKNEIGEYSFLVITGDCIDKGNVNLFDSFNKKLSDFIKRNGMNNKVIIVPGNHDISHDNNWFKVLLDNQKDMAEMNEYIETNYSAIFKEYNEFVGKYACPANGFGVKYIKCDELIFRVILINSSWSTMTNNKYGELLIGDKQISEIRNKLQNRKYDYTIACMHHPLDWLYYDERIKIQKFLYEELKVDFLFHGHIHEASYDLINNMDTNACIFCTGISYHKKGEKCSRKDGMRYSIYVIDKDAHTVNVFLRSTNNKGLFVADNRLYSKVNKDGFFSTPIGNITDCLLPLNDSNGYDKRYVFTNGEFVKALLHKEDYLFRYYCKMEKLIDQILQNEPYEVFFNIKTEGKKRVSNTEKGRLKKEYYKEIFEYFCMNVLIDLEALFFVQHKDVRLILRRYDPATNEHVAFLGEGTHSSEDEIQKIKRFKWGEGMIYASYKNKAPMLMSQNLKSHKEGNTKGIWKDYITIAIGGIEVRAYGEQIPLFALNIASESNKNEKCLQALSLSSIYDKLQEIFKIVQEKTMSLSEVYDI